MPLGSDVGIQASFKLSHQISHSLLHNSRRRPGCLAVTGQDTHNIAAFEQELVTWFHHDSGTNPGTNPEYEACGFKRDPKHVEHDFFASLRMQMLGNSYPTRIPHVKAA